MDWGRWARREALRGLFLILYSKCSHLSTLSPALWWVLHPCHIRLWMSRFPTYTYAIPPSSVSVCRNSLQNCGSWVLGHTEMDTHNWVFWLGPLFKHWILTVVERIALCYKWCYFTRIAGWRPLIIYKHGIVDWSARNFRLLLCNLASATVYHRPC